MFQSICLPPIKSINQLGTDLTINSLTGLLWQDLLFGKICYLTIGSPESRVFIPIARVHTRECHENKNTRFWATYDLTSKLFQQFAASLQISSCSKSDFHRLDPTWCVQQTCYKLLEQTCQDLLSTSLMQVVSTTCSKSTNIKLQQVWFSQLASALMRSTGLLQVVLSDLSRLVVHKLAASCYNNLQQVCKYQVAASLILQTCCNLMKSTDLLQLVDNLQQVGKIHNLQQVCGVSGCVKVVNKLFQLRPSSTNTACWQLHVDRITPTLLKKYLRKLDRWLLKIFNPISMMLSLLASSYFPRLFRHCLVKHLLTH